MGLLAMLLLLLRSVSDACARAQLIVLSGECCRRRGAGRGGGGGLTCSEVATAARSEFCWLSSRFCTASSCRRCVALSSTASTVRLQIEESETFQK
eukprot:COSAG06_NODE_414_length_16033_cov_67.366717_25_plen_96_part_00